ncbi:MAG TPA: tripartite tricarboxylate transporter substrate binding protein [Xanthobacteraceae bacterium]|nr:tripartite tricarboxylate transporter substrate binding protein [Xanthobacteraceae bacterium]
MGVARVLVTIILVLGVVFGAGAVSSAQTYPSRPIHLIVPYPAGGPTDVLARLVGGKLSAMLGQPVVVEDRPGGAGGTVGAKAVATAEPDGYTLLISQVGALTISPSIYRVPDLAGAKAFAPVALVAVSPQLLCVTPSLPVKSLPELIAYAKANPGKVNFGSAGVGSQPHVLGELLKLVADIKLTHVPYRGSAPAITDLLAGQIQMMFDTPVVMLPHIEAGKMRALAITSAARSPQLPNVPTVLEAGLPRLQANLWSGLLAPAGTPPEIVAKLNVTFNEGMNTPEMREALRKLGAEPQAMSPDAFGRFLASETQKWSTVVAEAGIKPE